MAVPGIACKQEALLGTVKSPFLPKRVDLLQSSRDVEVEVHGADATGYEVWIGPHRRLLFLAVGYRQATAGHISPGDTLGAE